MFLMISSYSVPLEEVDKVRSAHLAYLDELDGRGLILAAGRQDPPVGAVIILKVDTVEEAQALIADDPYVKAGLAEYKPIKWSDTRGLLKGL